MRAWTLVVFSFLYLPPVSAQVLPLPERRPAERPPLPPFRVDPAPVPFVLPPAPVQPEEKLSPGIRIFVSRFKVTGATAFRAEELEGLIARYAGRVVGNDELEEARLAITRHYFTAGYINSGAVIPDQEVRDGVVEIAVVEGRLAEIRAGGEHGFAPGYLDSRLAAAAGPPLNVNRLQERIQILLQDPAFERIGAELGAGTRPGESVLRLDVAEAPRKSVGLVFANNRSPAVGGERAELQLGYRNLSGWGDNLGLRLGKGQGVEDATALISAPVNAKDTVVGLKLEMTDTRVVEPPFDMIDIRNHSEYVEVGIAHPVYRTLGRRLDLGILLTRRADESSLLGQPFPFTPGIDDGRTVVSALRLVADWTDRTADRVFAARATAAQGLSAWGATVLDGGLPDSRFASFLAQLQLAQRIGAGQAILRGDWQHANGALLPTEKFPLGGQQSIRGYRENAVVRDNAWALSAEYRRPVAATLEAAVFTDYGKARDDQGPWTSLSSVGAGVRWTPWPGLLAQLYKGFALEDTGTEGDDIQDKGWHFSLAYQGVF
jgi:hemolysin activation/secretion protein